MALAVAALGVSACRLLARDGAHLHPVSARGLGGPAVLAARHRRRDPAGGQHRHPHDRGRQGPFAGESPDDRLLLAQGFLGIASITMLVMSAVITERRRAEEAVKAIAGTLQESLLPSHLPVIPGIETAVDFRAAGRRAPRRRRLLRPLSARCESWAVIVGDVLGQGRGDCGRDDRGLARYTLRAAAVQESQPSRMLRLLNDAILRQSPDQSCTVACGRIDLNSGGRGPG